MRLRLILALALPSAALLAIAACVGDNPGPIVAATPDGAPGPTTSSTAPPPASDAAGAADAGTTCEQRAKPDAADLTFCEDFDDPARDAGYTVSLFDGGRFAREIGTSFSPPGALNADPGTSVTPVERGGFLRWDVKEPTAMHLINTRVKLRPVVDTNTHRHDQGYTDLVEVDVGTAQIDLRYTYGRNLLGYPDYVGYALVVHLPSGSAGADGGDAGGSASDFTVVPLASAPPAGDWNETYLEVQLGDGGAVTLAINNLEVAKASVAIPPSTDATIQVGAHGIGQMDAPSQHFLDDIRVDVFQ